MQFHSIKRPFAALSEGSSWAGISGAIAAGVAIPHPYHIPVIFGGIMAVILKDPGAKDDGSQGPQQ